MDHKFDPINLTVFPTPGLLFKRSNAFVAGLVLNRIFFEIASANHSNPTKSPFEIKATIEKLEFWYGCLGKLAGLQSNFSDWFLSKIDHLEKKAAGPGTEVPPGDELILRRSYPELELMWLNQFISEAQRQCDSLVSVFEKEGQFFSLGLIIDGVTNGYTDMTSNTVLRKLSCDNPEKKSRWQIGGLSANPTANSQFLTSQPRSFIRRLKASNGGSLFHFDVLQKGAELPPPLDWAEAIVAVWSALAKEDQDEAGFRRVELNRGEIYLDGKLLGVLPMDNHPYIAFKYIVGELQNDPTKWFTSAKVYREIYKENPINVPKRRGPSETSLGKTVSDKTNSMRGETKTPEYGKLHKKIEKDIGNAFEKIDALNTRKGFTLRITQFSKAVLA